MSMQVTSASRAGPREPPPDIHGELSNLFAAMPLPVAILRGPELVYTMANPAYSEVVGARKLLGLPLLEALPELRGQGFDELLLEVMRSGTPQVRREAPLKLVRDGRLEDTYWTFIYAPIASLAGGPDSVIAICSEVTDHVKGREAIRRSEERYRYIFEAAGVSIWEQDFSAVKAVVEALKASGVTDLRSYFATHPDFVRDAIDLVRVVDVNAATLRLFGARDKAELTGSLRNILPAAAEAAFAEELLAIAEGRRLLESEAEVQTLSGEPRDVMFTIAFPDREGDFSSILVTLTDITERKQAERASRRSEKTLRVLYELTSAVGRAESVEDVYEHALDALIQALSADRASVLLFDADGVMRFKAWRGLSDGYRKQTEGHSPWSRDERDPVPLTIADIATDPNIGPLRATIAAEGIGALGFIPLVYGGRLLGKFMVYFDRPHRFTEDETNLAVTIGNHIAHALERQRGEAALRESAAILQIVNEGTSTLLYAKDSAGRITMANPATMRALATTPADAIGKVAAEYWSDKSGAAQVMANDRRVMESGVAQSFEESVMLADGPHVFLSSKAPLRDPSGAVVGIIGASVDVTDLKRAEERQKLLVRELNHRVKNTLATVQSIAAQTFRGGEVDQEARRAFEARLFALSDAHNVLTRESWDGAAIEEIVATALAPHRAQGRFTIEGVPLRLKPKAALALAMALHELATNAAKYGALSVPAGRVHVEWSVSEQNGEPRFQFRWSEHDGPRLATPQRKGFGSRLIQRGISLELGGAAEMKFKAGGLVYTIDAALANVSGSAEDDSPSEPAAAG